MKGKTIILSAFVCLLPTTMLADELPDSIYKSLELEQVVVTGTRTPKLLANTPVLTKLITADDIMKTDATNLRDVLQQVIPGIEFSYAMNQQVHMNFSGFGGQSMLILVDGERLAGETMDDVDFTRIGMDNVDHIEIVKGAASALYGSNAAGGVINIITKKKPNPCALNLNMRFGRHNEQRYGMSWQYARGKWNNLFTVNRNSSDNFNVHNGPNPITRVVSTIYGDAVWNFKEQLTFRLNEKLRLTGRAGYFYRQLVRTSEVPERYRDFSGGLRGMWTPDLVNSVDFSYAFDQYDKSDYQGFRAPTLKEKYYNFDMSGIWIVEGNPSLKPEVSQNFNASVDYTKGRYNFTISAYCNRIENKIATGAPYYKNSSDIIPRLPYLNLDNYIVSGGEATAQARWKNGLTARLSYAYTHERLPKDKNSNSVNNQYIPARKHSMTGHIDWDHQWTKNYGTNIGLDGRFLSAVDNEEFVDYYDISKGIKTIHYPAYALFKLSLVQRIAKGVKVSVILDNIFNYKPEYYYLNCPLTDGTNLMIGMSVDVDKLF